MRRFFRRLMSTITAAVTLFLVVTACHVNDYDTGDSKYSYLRADFVEARTNSEGLICKAVTDDGDSLFLSPLLKTSWGTRPDTLYRALLYYNKGETNASLPSKSLQAFSVIGVGASQVYVLRPQNEMASVVIADDGVGFQSAWQSANKRYINMALVLKGGKAENVDNKHILGVVRDSVVTNQQGHHTYFYRLYHLQNGVPAYYSSTIYASIPMSFMRAGDTLQLTIRTSQKGVVVRKFAF